MREDHESPLFEGGRIVYMTDLESVRCPRCGCGDSSLMFCGRDRFHDLPGTYYVSSCNGCGLWFQNPRVQRDAIAGLYPGNYAPHLEPPQSPSLSDTETWVLRQRLGYAHLVSTPRPALVARHRELRQRTIELDPHFVPGGSVLEIGCASGWRLQRLRILGWERVEGIEVVEAAASRAAQLGFCVHHLPVEDGLSLYSDASLDVVITSMVLEHLVDPFVVVRAIADKIRPGGELLFSTVLRDSIDARIWGTYWRNLDLPRHMVWFTSKDLRAMLEEKFEDVTFVRQAEPGDIIGSARFRQEEKRVLFDSLITRYVGERRLVPVARLLSRLAMTSRVSVRARKVR